MKKYAVILVAVAFLSACVSSPVDKLPVPVSGSRADGTVTLSYEYGLFEKPVVNWDEAKKTSEKRCQAWDYKTAESFGGIESDCISSNGYAVASNALILMINSFRCVSSVLFN